MEEFFRNNIRDYALIFLNKNISDYNFEGLEFVNFIYKRLFGIDVDKSYVWKDKVDNIDIGDLLIFDKELGIYIGDNKFIYVFNNKISVSELDSYWLDELVGVKDIVWEIKKTI